jgi:lipopolysaccharide transport system ATP-binding protein
MSDIAVEVNHVWKRFHRGEIHHSLRDLVPAMAKRLAGRGPKRDELAKGDFWALKDVSFQVKQGEALGIIGANGAGKSTLLKILAKILKPNRGSIKANGRLRALIEVAAGFHGDLTGRENIYLNGAILGMTRREIDRKFEEIVDFSGIEPSLDTPVKRYSSGMYARLGFAVAAHLDPDVLIVDEVLSVGDASFQQRCLGRMSDVARSGTTVLFVSHNMAAIQSICETSVLLNSGSLDFVGATSTAVERYLAKMSTDHGGCKSLRSRGASHTGATNAMQSVTVTNTRGAPTAIIVMGEGLSVVVEYESPRLIHSPVLGVVVKSLQSGTILGINNRIIPGYEFRQSGNSGRVSCHFDHLPLMPGKYSVDLYLGNAEYDVDTVTDAITFEIVPADVFGSGKLPPSIAGPVYWPARFSIE